MLVMKFIAVSAGRLAQLAAFVNTAHDSTTHTSEIEEIRKAGKNWIVVRGSFVGCDDEADKLRTPIVTMDSKSYTERNVILFRVEIRIIEAFSLWDEEEESFEDGFETSRAFVNKVLDLLGRF